MLVSTSPLLKLLFGLSLGSLQELQAGTSDLYLANFKKNINIRETKRKRGTEQKRAIIDVATMEVQC